MPCVTYAGRAQTPHSLDTSRRLRYLVLLLATGAACDDRVNDGPVETDTTEVVQEVPPDGQPEPQTKPDLKGELLSRLTKDNAGLRKHSWQEACLFEPAIQVSEGTIRVQYVQGDADYDKPDVAQTMWKFLQEIMAVSNGFAGEKTIIVQTYTPNGQNFYSSVNPPDRLRDVRDKQIDFDYWLKFVKAGRKHTAPPADIISVLQGLPAAAGEVANMNETMREEIIAFVEDLKCVDSVTKLSASDGTISLSYLEGCGNYQPDSLRYTMYEIAMRLHEVFERNKIRANVALKAKAINSGRRVRQSINSSAMAGLTGRAIGIVDWMIGAHDYVSAGASKEVSSKDAKTTLGAIGLKACKEGIHRTSIYGHCRQFDQLGAEQMRMAVGRESADTVACACKAVVKDQNKFCAEVLRPLTDECWAKTSALAAGCSWPSQGEPVGCETFKTAYIKCITPKVQTRSGKLADEKARACGMP